MILKINKSMMKSRRIIWRIPGALAIFARPPS